MANTPQDITEELKNTINVMLRKDYVFFGVVNYSDKLPNQYKFIFRKTLKYNNQTTFEIIHHNGIIRYEELEKYVKLNNDKVLVSVLKTYINNTDKVKKIKDNFLIFKKTGENEVYDTLITEVIKDKYTEFSIYLKDISSKMNGMMNNDEVKFNLTCCVNNDRSLFLVFYEKLEKSDEERTIFENND